MVCSCTSGFSVTSNRTLWMILWVLLVKSRVLIDFCRCYLDCRIQLNRAVLAVMGARVYRLYFVMLKKENHRTFMIRLQV